MFWYMVDLRSETSRFRFRFRLVVATYGPEGFRDRYRETLNLPA